VPLAKSPASTNTVFIPRSCESSEQPLPVAPPPIMQMSNVIAAIRSRASERFLISILDDRGQRLREKAPCYDGFFGISWSLANKKPPKPNPQLFEHKKLKI
jgi:hypothetical protein